MNLENIMLNLKSQLTKTTYCMIQLIQKVQTRQSDRTTGGSLRLEVRQVLGEMGGNGFTGWWKCSQMFSGYGCTALWIYKNHGIIYVQLVNHLVCELYLKKAFFKKKKRSMGWNVLELNGWELSVFLTQIHESNRKDDALLWKCLRQTL